MKKFVLIVFAVLTVLILTGCPEPASDPVTSTVSYSDNGSDGGIVPVSTVYEEGATVTVSGNTGSLVKMQDGISLIFSWNTRADGNGSDYKVGSGTFSMGSSDVTLYANWTAIGGEGPAGGLVFYDDEADGVDDISGARYLEAAPVSTEWENNRWEEDGTAIPGTGTAIGEGSNNTLIVAAWLDSDSQSDMAAQLCRDLTEGGYTWFLPSKDELTEMYINLKLEDAGGFSNDDYWSSSQSSTNTALAWSRTFTDGIEHSYMKSNYFRVRAVRSF